MIYKNSHNYISHVKICYSKNVPSIILHKKCKWKPCTWHLNWYIWYVVFGLSLRILCYHFNYFFSKNVPQLTFLQSDVHFVIVCAVFPVDQLAHPVQQNSVPFDPVILQILYGGFWNSVAHDTTCVMKKKKLSIKRKTTSYIYIYFFISILHIYRYHENFHKLALHAQVQNWETYIHTQVYIYWSLSCRGTAGEK